MDKTQIAQRLGAAEREIIAVEESAFGWVAHMLDGTSYVGVAPETPDGDGKTGVMYLRKPTPAYNGSFPVFTGDTAAIAHPTAPAIVEPAEPVPVEAEVPAPAAVAEPVSTPAPSAETPVPLAPTATEPATAPAPPPAS